MGTTLEAATWPIVTAPEAAAILVRFPQAGAFEQLVWHSPRPFSAAALLRTDRGEFVLKRHHPRLRSPAALAKEHAFMAHLRAAGICVPDVVATEHGTGALAHDGWTVELHRRAPGLDLYRDRPSWTPFLTPSHAHAAGDALARLHRAAQGFVAGERRAHPLVASFTILPARDSLAAAEAYVAARPALARYLADKPWRADLARLFAVLGTGLSEHLADQPVLWTHNDWHPSNMLWAADGTVSTVFDFGLAAPTCALHDLATAIERTAIPWLDISEGRHDAPTDGADAVALLRGYQARTALSRADIATILRLLPLVHLEFALSEIDYFAGVLQDRDQADLAWHGYALGHADWFLSPPGQRFLQQLERDALA